MKNKLRRTIWAATSVMALFAFQMYSAYPAEAALSGVGPVSVATGFPAWYSDSNGLTLEHCSDPTNNLCLADPVVAGNVLSEQNGFGGESFYWLGEATMGLPGGGQALLVMGLEAAYATGDPAPGQEMVFTRIRVRIDAPADGTYTITHPFGSKSYNVTAGTRTINDTVDIGTVPLAFDAALGGNIGPFLTAVSPAPPAGYIGNPLVAQTVTGSPTGSNFFRIQGPAGSNLSGTGSDTIQTNLFTISGKIAVPVLTTINVTPANPSVIVGNTTQLSASALDQNGTAISPAPPITWTSSDSNVATVNASGLVTALSAGTATITATSGTVSGQITVTVEAPVPVLTTINISPVNPAIEAGATVQMTAVALDQNGAAIIPAPAVTWTSSNPGVATVDASGLVNGISAGTSIITATSGTISGTTTALVFAIPTPDTTPPVITVNGTNPVSVTQNSVYIDAGAAATDDVDGAVNVISSGTVDNATVGSYTITYTATDVAGNVAIATRIVNVVAIPPVDTTPPVITVTGPNPVSVEIGTIYVDAGASATDDVDGAVTVVTSGTVNTAVIGTYTLIYTAFDAAGNTSTTSRTVNVIVIPPVPDIIPPVITINGANSINVIQNSVYTDTGATAVDDVDGIVNVVTSGTVDTATIGTYAITYTAADAAGNIANATRTVNVIADQPIPDTVPPVITINGINPVSINVGEIYNDAGATATDDVDGAVNVVTTGTVNTDVVGTFTITYTSTDVAGNIATATRTINVVTPNPAPDTTPPVITVNGTNPVSVTQNSVYIDAGAAATDDVDGAVNVTSSGAVDTAIIGTYTITYTATDTAGNVATATRTVNVAANDPTPVLTSIKVMPLYPTVRVSGSQQFTAVGLDQNNTALAIQPTFIWTSGTTATGTINSSGIFTAISQGTSLITASSGDIAGNTTIIVVPKDEDQVLTIIKIQDNPSISRGSAVNLSVQVLDQIGRPMKKPQILSWTSDNEQVATVDSKGSVTGVSAGKATITATSGNVSASTIVNVTDIVVAPNQVLTTINMSPTNVQVQIGKSQRLDAIGLDQNGQPLAPQPVFTWLSSNGTVGSVSSQGIFIANAVGTTNITVSSNNVSASFLVTVTETEPEKSPNDKKKKKKNTPVKLKAPSSLRLHPGEKALWKASSRNGIVEHKITFRGKTWKQADNRFIIPSDTPPGKYHLEIRSIDKSQRTSSEGITIYVEKP